ncbi:MAG: acyloxyacyl hydrolase [Bacteroidales bacterium]|jgi:hypothetical protein|nr:acyloxyacyl hydrolase [Bacteroidales bacterium]
MVKLLKDYRVAVAIGLTFLLCINDGLAQKFKNSDFFIEAGLRYGAALHHPQSAIYLKDFYYPSVELRFGQQTSGKNKWEQMLYFPSYGVTLRYTSYWDFMDTKSEWQERNKLMGQSLALFGYFKGNIIRYKWFSWNYQIGMGAVYFTKIYQKDVVYKPDNLTPDPNNPNNYLSDELDANGNRKSKAYPDNCMISLYVTPYINLQSGLDFQLTPQLDLSLQANFTHASNASMNMPNFGINEVSAIANIRYHFNAFPAPVKCDTYPKHKPVNSLFFTVDPGWLIARYDDNYYFKTCASVGYMRDVLPILRVGLSFEAFYVRYLSHSKDYNTTLWSTAFTNTKDAQAAGIDPNNPTTRIHMPQNIYTGAFYAFGELAFSRFALHIGVGAYIFKGPDQAKYMDLAQNWDNGGTLKHYPWIYEKVGFRVYLGKKMNHFVGASLRAHAPVADYLAFDYGYRFYNFFDVKRKK